jgi:hypothetical protein
VGNEAPGHHELLRTVRELLGRVVNLHCTVKAGGACRRARTPHAARRAPGAV